MIDAPFRLPATWPGPHDIGAADRLIERFAELGRSEARLAARSAVAALLRSLGGNSPYLADLAVHESASLRAIIATGPDAIAASALRDLAEIAPSAGPGRGAAPLPGAQARVAPSTPPAGC